MKKQHLKLFLFVCAVLAIGGTIHFVGLPRILAWLEQFRSYVKGLGALGFFLYALVFGVGCMLGLPASPFTIGAGVVFGFSAGLATSLFGAALGGAGGFLVGRYAARDEIARRLQGHPKFAAIDTAVGNEGWKIIGLLRMCPFPYGLTNYLYGLTSIPFWPYLAATMAGILPGLSFFVYIGAAGKTSLDAAGQMQRQPPGVYVMLGVGLLAGVAAMIFVGRVARRAVAKATIRDPQPPGDLVEISSD